ncbi:MAG: DinB family protein [Pseudomonadota bacterium]
MLAHPHRMARFSHWANQRMQRACASLSAEALAQDRQAFFGSILGTLNHILLVDLLYQERLLGTSPSRFNGLDEILHPDLDSLAAEQSEIDAFYIDYTADLDDDALAKPVGFTTLLAEAEYWEVPRSVYFSNLFQHQVHHRGQAHAMLSQSGLEPPPIGFIEFELERAEHILRRPA